MCNRLVKGSGRPRLLAMLLFRMPGNGHSMMCGLRLPPAI